ncbi:30S ribosomal protein S6 [Emcibacter sp. SYSU 3D8]|uniref:30S ribosomal protein S6 n=1 Tax=Emcibacter sp. SYSU 3D8 TaxID=3133969 RepID=UPI0031FED321
MAYYEHVLIARQDISSQAADTLAEEFAGIIQNNGGSVTKTENWGLRTLAYRIKKNRKGHYIMMNIDAPPAAVAEMERLEKINEDVIRAMTIRVEVLDEEPSPVLRTRDEREERRGREGGRF